MEIFNLMNKTFSKFVATVSFVFYSLTPSMANIVTNGDFESGNFGWTTSSVLMSGGTSWAHGGSGYAYTGCSGHACVSNLGSGAYFGQTLPTTLGATYELSFWLGENLGPTSEMSVFWNGLMVADVLNPANSSDLLGAYPKYVKFTFSGLSATSEFTYFEIHGRQDPAYMFFDDVSVTQSETSVPEPESLALVGIALAGLGLTRRNAKQA